MDIQVFDLPVSNPVFIQTKRAELQHKKVEGERLAEEEQDYLDWANNIIDTIGS